MTHNPDSRKQRKATVRQTSRGAEATHVWVRADEGISRSRRGGMSAGLQQEAAPSAATGGGGFSDLPPTDPTSPTGYAASGPSPAARAMFGGAVDALAARPTPAVSFGAQKWGVSVKPASTQRAMAALDDFRHVGTPFRDGTVAQAFATAR